MGNYECTSRSILERNNYQIVLCEECPCETKEQLLAIERKWIETNDCVNVSVPLRTTREYHSDNKEKIREYNKQYLIENPPDKKSKAEYDTQYRKIHEEKIKKAKAEYYQKNRDRLIQKSKDYYNKNKVSE